MNRQAKTLNRLPGVVSEGVTNFTMNSFLVAEPRSAA